MVTITVDIFSGRPNPTWMLSDDAALPLLEEIAKARHLLTPADETRSVLGFRGIHFHITDDLSQKTGLPPLFRLAGGLTDREPDALVLARLAVETMPLEAVEATVDRLTPRTPDLLQFLRDSLREPNAPQVDQAFVEEPPPQPSGEQPRIDGNCRYEVAPFDPNAWNVAPHLTTNNCYNFGTNRRWDNFAQPGRAGGAPAVPPYTCQNVTAGAFSDGLRLRGQGATASEKPRYFIALAVMPNGVDYHWWRQCTEYWGHKPGDSQATRRDSSGQLITDPATCDRGAYTKFCGYFYVPRHINLKGR